MTRLKLLSRATRKNGSQIRYFGGFWVHFVQRTLLVHATSFVRAGHNYNLSSWYSPTDSRWSKKTWQTSKGVWLWSFSIRHRMYQWLYDWFMQIQPAYWCKCLLFITELSQNSYHNCNQYTIMYVDFQYACIAIFWSVSGCFQVCIFGVSNKCSSLKLACPRAFIRGNMVCRI